MPSPVPLPKSFISKCQYPLNSYCLPLSQTQHIQIGPAIIFPWQLAPLSTLLSLSIVNTLFQLLRLATLRARW
jgi:hypothetical protein